MVQNEHVVALEVVDSLPGEVVTAGTQIEVELGVVELFAGIAGVEVARAGVVVAGKPLEQAPHDLAERENAGIQDDVAEVVVAGFQIEPVEEPVPDIQAVDMRAAGMQVVDTQVVDTQAADTQAAEHRVEVWMPVLECAVRLRSDED